MNNLRCMLCCLILFNYGNGFSTQAQEKVPAPQAAPPLAEYWEAIYLQGAHVGHSHGVYRPFRSEQIISTEELTLSLNRFNQLLRMQFSFTMVETKDGKIRQFTIKQSMGRDDELVRSGIVEKNEVRITKTQGDQAPVTKVEPWNDSALGLYAMEQLYKSRELKPGLEFDFKSFSSDFNTVLNYHVSVSDKQPTNLLGGRNLPFWRVTVKLQKIGEIQLPPMICWVNDKGEVYKREQSIPGLGDLTFYRTRKESAVPSATATVKNPNSDIGFSQLIKLNRSFNQFNNTRSVEYRVKLKDLEGFETAFANEPRQVVKVIGKDELAITAKWQETPVTTASNKKPPAEYLRSNHFITSDDEIVKRLAKSATTGSREPWQKARAIEAYVHQKMTNKDYGKAFATAAETARTLDGDCTEHAVLAAAMCRAVGVPSRTAIGLVHVPSERAMCFHMWFEVWIDGQWYSLDATLGQGHIAGGHVKVLDAHWNDTDSFLPLLPVTRLLGKLKMDVLSVEYEAGVGPR